MNGDLFATNSQGEAVVRDPWTPSVPAQEAREEHRREHDRVVSAGLEAAVLRFCREKGAGYVFDRERELVPWLKSQGFTFREDSARKMLDNLKGKGLVDYESRRGWVTLRSVSHVEAKP